MLDNGYLELLRNRWVLLAIFILLLPVSFQLADGLGRAGFLHDLASCVIWIATGLLGLWIATRRVEEQ